jgi:hypothetical protein
MSIRVRRVIDKHFFDTKEDLDAGVEKDWAMTSRIIASYEDLLEAYKSVIPQDLTIWHVKLFPAVEAEFKGGVRVEVCYSEEVVLEEGGDWVREKCSYFLEPHPRQTNDETAFKVARAQVLRELQARVPDNGMEAQWINCQLGVAQEMTLEKMRETLKAEKKGGWDEVHRVASDIHARMQSN